MKSISRKLSALVNQSELPFTNRSCVFLNSNMNAPCIFKAISKRIFEDIDIYLYHSLKINYICNDSSFVLSSTVNKIDPDNIEEMLRHTLPDSTLAFNIDFFKFSDLPDKFVKEKYQFTILFIMI